MAKAVPMPNLDDARDDADERQRQADAIREAEVAALAPDFMNSPEFAAAVAAAVDKAIGPILERVAVVGGVNTADANAADPMAFFRQMALAIAEVNDQDVGSKKRMDPAVLAKMAAGRERMIASILRLKAEFDAGKPGVQRPLYKVIAKMYLNERLVDPFTVDPYTKRPEHTRIRWSGAPNEAMRPENDEAKEIFGHFLAAINRPTLAQGPAVEVWVTHGGLVIEQSSGGKSLSGGGVGAPRTMMDKRGFDTTQVEALPNFDDDLSVVDGNAHPGKTHINVLGTIAPPARQTSGVGA